mgnify:CR=1 FL=1
MYQPKRDLTNGQLVGWEAVSYTHLRAHETVLDLVCRLLLEKKNTLYTTLYPHHIRYQVIALYLHNDVIDPYYHLRQNTRY